MRPLTCAMGEVFFAGMIMLLAGGTGRAQIVEKVPAGLEGLVSLESKLEKIATGFGFTEGVTWVQEGQSGHLLFSDMPANVIYRWSSDGRTEIALEKCGYQKPDVWRVGMEFTNGKPAGSPEFEKFNMFGCDGLALDDQKRLVIATWAGRSVVRVEKDGTRTILADRFEGKRLGGPNDVVVRRDGTVYFTDTYGGMLKLDKDPSKELDTQGVYMIRDGKTVRVIDDIPNANGLAFSPDEKILYANGSRDRFVRRYAVNADGTVGKGTLFIDLSTEPAPGITDGMKVDQLGNLWTSGPGGIWIISPAGKPLGIVTVPEGVTNLVFGGPERKTVYISAKTSIYRIETKVAGAR